MGWWTTIVEKTQAATDTITKGAKWIWDWTYSPLATATNFVASTLTSVLEQGIALKKSVPALASPQSAKIAKAAAAITVYHIMPLIVLNVTNNYVQATLRTGYSDDEEHNTLYNSLAISASTMLNWGVWAYTTQRSTHMLAQTLAVDTMGAAAFNTAKEVDKEQSPCELEGCNFKRRMKGSFREFFVLFLYDLLTGGVSYIPQYGNTMALLLKIGFSGDIIARGATIERCERHRTTDPATVWSLGLVYALTEMLIDRGLESTVGIPPYLVHRTMRHLLLLLFINNATHMKINYVAPGKGSLPIDPIIAYGKASGILADILITGSKEQISKLFQPRPNQEPIISVPAVLKKLTKALNSDLEKISQPKPGFFKSVAKKAVPAIYYNSKAAVNDPVISIFWPDIQELALDVIDIVEKAGIPLAKISSTDVPLVATAVRKALPELLYQRYGISQQVTGFLINLCKDEDFWSFMLALKQWLIRHDLRERPPLALASAIQLASLHDASAPPVPNETEENSAKTPLPIKVILNLEESRGKRTLNPLLFNRVGKRQEKEASNLIVQTNVFQDNYF